jgi:hypothetical protein
MCFVIEKAPLAEAREKRPLVLFYPEDIKTDGSKFSIGPR